MLQTITDHDLWSPSAMCVPFCCILSIGLCFHRCCCTVWHGDRTNRRGAVPCEYHTRKDAKYKYRGIQLLMQESLLSTQAEHLLLVCTVISKLAQNIYSMFARSHKSKSCLPGWDETRLSPWSSGTSSDTRCFNIPLKQMGAATGLVGDIVEAMSIKASTHPGSIDTVLECLRRKSQAWCLCSEQRTTTANVSFLPHPQSKPSRCRMPVLTVTSQKHGHPPRREPDVQRPRLDERLPPLLSLRDRRSRPDRHL